MRRIRRAVRQVLPNIVSGVLLVLPLVTTLYVFVKLFDIADSMVPSLFHAILPRIPREWPPFVGLFIILIIAYFAGLAAKNYFGRKLIETGNTIIANIPFLNKVYLGIQQIIDAFVANKKKLFDRAVLLEYPKAGSYCIGFVTANTRGEVPLKVGSETVSIFVPTTPNPTSGFLLFLPASEVIELDMSVETAIKTVMSAGVVSSDQLKSTQHMYRGPSSGENWNWLRMFHRKQRGHPPFDPRD